MTTIGRRRLTLAALLLLAGAPAVAQDRLEAAALREELMALERQSWEYLKTRDRAGMRHFLADGAVLIFADGTSYDKRELLDFMPDYRLDFYEIGPGYGLRTISPTAAALVYRVTSRGAARFTRTETTRVLATSLYVRRDGKWLCIRYQETPSQ